MKVSNSEMRAYKECPRRWYFRYYRELDKKKPDVTGPLALGTKVHLALELLYSMGDDPEETVTNLYISELEDMELDDAERKKLNNEMELAKAMMEGFVQWREEEGIDAGLDIVSQEEVVEVPGPHGVTLRGKLDQRVKRQHDGLVLFRDWKTTQSFTDRWLLVSNEQMLFYNLLLKLRDGEPIDGALYTMLRKVKRTAAAKPPFYLTEEVRHNEAQLESMWLRVTQTVGEMVQARERLDAGEDPRIVVPPVPGRDCLWKCPFVAVCPLVDDGSRWEAALEENYEHSDPHERYNDNDDQ